MNLAVLVTCHNRREKTLRCIESLFAQEPVEDLSVQTWLVDDGSSDGTGEAVAKSFASVRLIAGDGSLFWCAGMRLAWLRAAETKPDAFLWLNDDVVLEADALATLHAVAARHAETIVVGSCACPDTGVHTYGGLRRAGSHPGRIEPIAPADEPRACDTFEGNIVWIPWRVFARLGPLDRFQHAMGDVDYGYRAARAGIPSLIAPGVLGVCGRNPKEKTWEDPRLPRRTRFQKLKSIKGLPPKDWWRFCRRHGGLRAPLYFVGPYLRIARGR